MGQRASASTWAGCPGLAGQRVLVTAGADGIGLAMVRGFAAAGARVLACDIRDDRLAALSGELPAVLVQPADVSLEADVARLFAQVDAQLGGLDLLVNNAGIAGPTGGIETLSLADWERTLAVNLTGQFLCARAAVPRLRQGRSPGIINLSSAAGRLGMPGRAPYSASKWGVVGLTKTLAIELGPDGIRVNALLPGAVDGPRIRAVIAAKAHSSGRMLDEVTREYTAQSALGRMVSADDVARMALFVASDLAANITGQALAVDGHTQALT